MQSSLLTSRKTRGFTLIELLVVIAIIAILAAILFPVFAQAKAAAKKTNALSNVKQTALGVIIYLGDADDVFPQGAGVDPIKPSNSGIYKLSGGWSVDTQPYIKSLALLRDPSDPMSKNTWQAWYTSFSTVSLSFASNGYLDDIGEGWGLYGVMGFNEGPGLGWTKRGITSQSSVNLVAESIMLSSRYDGNNCFLGGDLMAGQNWYDDTGPALLPNGSRDGTPYLAPSTKGGTYVVNKNNRFGAVAAPYADNGVFAFVDGHAKAMNPIKTNPQSGADFNEKRSKNMWDVYRS